MKKNRRDIMTGRKGQLVAGLVTLVVGIFGLYVMFELKQIIPGLIMVIAFGGTSFFALKNFFTKTDEQIDNQNQENSNMRLMLVKDLITNEYGQQYLIFALMGQREGGSLYEERLFTHKVDFDERDLSQGALFSININLLLGHEDSIDYEGTKITDISDISFSEFKEVNKAVKALFTYAINRTQ